MHLRFLGILLLAISAPAQAPAAFDWQLDQTLPARNNHSFAFHGATGRVLLFGGTAPEVYGDTWTFGDAWQRIEASPAPSPRANASLAYDSARSRVILFGGRTDTAVFADTWAFDGATWTQLTPPVSPGPLYGASVAYDSSRDRVVLFGGWPNLNTAPSTQLWEFDGTSWELRPQGGTVPSPFTASIVYDASRALTLLLTGTLQGWDGAAWQPVSTTGLPQPLPSGPLVFDSDAQRVMLVTPFSGSSFGTRLDAVYAWTGTAWTIVATPTLPTENHVWMAWDPTRHRVVGQEQLAFSPSYARTWTLEQGAWQVVARSAPRGRRDAAMAYDSARRRLVVHGGAVNFSAQFDTNELDDRTWFSGSGGIGGPLSRRYHSMVYDEARSVVVMYGGLDFGENIIATWDGSGAWGAPPMSGAPVARRTPAMAYDSLRARTVVFGGEAMTGNLADLWAWDGSTWTDITPAVSPPARRRARLSYDRARDRVVLFGGSTGTALFGDTWEYDGSQWLQAAPPTSPAPRAAHVQVYDSHRHLTLLFGGEAEQGFRDTWAWDGSAWTQQTTAHQPDVGAGACGAYDSDRREVVIFGGADMRGEVWRLRDPALAQWTSEGQGCEAGGAGPLALEGLDPLAIGTTCRVRMANARASFVVLPIGWVGFQDQQWNGLPLPLSLAALGAPGCFVLADLAVIVPMLALGNGTATADLVVPDVPALVGAELFVQAGTWDFEYSRIGTTNAVSARIGVR